MRSERVTRRSLSLVVGEDAPASAPSQLLERPVRAHGHWRADGLEQRQIVDVIGVERRAAEVAPEPIGDGLSGGELGRAVEDLALDEPRAQAALEAHARADELVDAEVAG